ncbi:MAG: glycosyltransferase family 4 protein [Oscillospiraceae bacterium]|nr:glycosyltransferase family 4 protein [Oscillospiraceae bacterium]
MKILYTATVLSHICQFHLLHMQHLQEQGWEVHVAAHDNLAVKNGLQLKYCDKFIETPFSRSPKSPNNLKAYRQLKKLLSEEHYDVILCNTPMGGIVTRLAAKKTRRQSTKVIYMAHGFHFCKGSSKKNWLIFYPIEKYMAKFCDLLITINEEDYALAQKKFNRRTKIAHIHGVGVDETRYHPATPEEQLAMRKAEGLSSEDFVILCTGELNENKNQKTLISAAAQLKDRIPNLKILLAGNGPKEQELRDQIREEGLEGVVKLLGYRTDLERITPAVDLVVSCSRREGMPLNIIEAMLCAKPVVASHNRGHDELVSPGRTGILLTPTDTAGFAAAIDALATNAVRRNEMGEAALRWIQPYAVSNTREELYGLLQSLIE